MLFDVFIGAYTKSFYHNVNMFEFQMRHIFQKPIKLSGTFPELQGDGHVYWIMGFFKSFKNLLEICIISTQLQLLQPFEAS